MCATVNFSYIITEHGFLLGNLLGTALHYKRRPNFHLSGPWVTLLLTVALHSGIKHSSVSN